jgi:hypothetical protein
MKINSKSEESPNLSKLLEDILFEVDQIKDSIERNDGTFYPQLLDLKNSLEKLIAQQPKQP